MFYSIAIIYLAAHAYAFSTAALSQSCSRYSLATLQNHSEAQIHTNKDFLAVAVDENTSQFPLGGLSTYIKTSSSKGGGAQTPPQQEDKETTKEKSKVTLQSPDEDEGDYILDESGCPELTKNMFHCYMCGGSDENGRCKGDPEYDNEYAGCNCTPDPDWSVNPPGLVRPGHRERRQARRRQRLRDKVSSSGAATVADSHGSFSGQIAINTMVFHYGRDSPNGVHP